jgi:hypothetical protein
LESQSEFKASDQGEAFATFLSTVDSLGMSPSSDLHDALAIAFNAEAFRGRNSKTGLSAPVGSVTALIGTMLADRKVSRAGQLSALDWVSFLDVSGLDQWSEERPASVPTDAVADDAVMLSVGAYAGPYGEQRPTFDALAFAWGLLVSDVELPDRIRKQGGDPNEFTLRLRAEIDWDVDSTSDADTDSEPVFVTDKLRTLTDAPAEVDLLNRKPLAESLATRLRTTRTDDPQTSFLLHVDGPWGSGKSTLLNFLQDELESDSLVVYFNAWREQRSGPPWWGMLSTLRRTAVEDGGWKYRARESLAMLKGLGARFWVAVVLAIVVIGGLFLWATGGARDLDALGRAASSIAAIVALIATVWALVVRLGRSRAPGSLSSATRYLENQADPMQAIANRFNSVVDLVGKPVVIFVDDLDRCSGSYVVEFLEAVQTLVRETPRTPGSMAPHFVVAADGRWIRASYEHEYADFVEVVSYPGRPLGYLFLDKAFQLTTTLPAIDENQRRRYWEQLLRIEPDRHGASVDEAPTIAQSILGNATTDADILDLVDAQGADDSVLLSALRAEAVKLMARPSTVSSTEHALRGYADLLDPNPRAMKRFVNAYGVERALRTIEGRRPDSSQLARWVIVELRWPLLADVLRRDPEAVWMVGSAPQTLIDSDRDRIAGVVDLIDDRDVKRTILDPDPRYGYPLDVAGIIASAGLPEDPTKSGEPEASDGSDV